MDAHELCQHLDDAAGADAAGHIDRQALAGPSVDDGQALQCLSIRTRVIEVLTQLVSVHGTPRYLRSDNGPEFVAAAILPWLHEADHDEPPTDPIGGPNRRRGGNATVPSTLGRIED